MWRCKRSAPGTPRWPTRPSRPLLSHQPLPGELLEPRLPWSPIRLETIQPSQQSRHRPLFCSPLEPRRNRQVDFPALDDLRKAQVYPAACRIQTRSSPLARSAKVQRVSRTETRPGGCHSHRSSSHGLIAWFYRRISRPRGERCRCGFHGFQDLETHHAPSRTDDLLDTLCLVLLCFRPAGVRRGRFRVLPRERDGHVARAASPGRRPGIGTRGRGSGSRRDRSPGLDLQRI